MDCTYCGEPADTRDHIVPSIFADGEKRSFSDAKNLVPACFECNVTASSKYFGEGADGVRGKAAYLSGVYSRKYRRLLGAPGWTANDIKRNLRGNLRKLVTAEQLKRRIVQDRLVRLDLVAISHDGADEKSDVWPPRGLVGEI